MHGHGILRYAGGTAGGIIAYEGDFKDGKCHGKGKATYSDGRTFEGEFCDGFANGYGTVYHPGGSIAYQGPFKDAKRHTLRGQRGFSERKDGRTYSGEYKNNIAEGQGVYTFPEKKNQCLLPQAFLNENVLSIIADYTDESWDRKCYQGSWKAGFYHGNGKCEYWNGNSLEGNWVNGHLQGAGTLRYRDGTCYEGNFQRRQQHGKGRETFPNGDIFEGLYQFGKPSEGILTLSNGTRFQQKWNHGEEIRISLARGESTAEAAEGMRCGCVVM